MKNDLFFKDSRLPFVECRCSMESSAVFKPHMHKTFSVGAVLSGQVHYTVGSQEEVLTQGSLAVINPEIKHSCNALHTNTRSFYMLYLDTDWCFRVQETLWAIDSFVQADCILLEDKKLYNLYCTTMTALMAVDVHLLKKEQLVIEFFLSFFEKVCSQQPLRQEQEEGIDFLKEILSGDLGDDLSLDAVAEKTGINLYTLIRQFKAATSMTPHAYRMNCRIDKAKQLLQQGRDIADTALECGFFDQSHLHRYFKAMTTVTPKEYQVNFLQ